MSDIKRGNAVVGQSGGPTAAINATLAGVVRRWKAYEETEGMGCLYGMLYGIEGMLENKLVNLSEYFDTEDKMTALEKTPAAALGSCRKRMPKDPMDPLYEEVFACFRKYDIRYFFYIGGNDSMDTVSKLTRAAEVHAYPISIIGIPKTIDNDLQGTDHTPGYGSAAKYVAVTTQEIIRDCRVYQIPAVTIVEIMGRDAGWLAAAAGLPKLLFGDGPDYIYLPECVFSVEKFLSDVREALSRHPAVVIAVSEGVRNADGEYIGALGNGGKKDAFGHAYLSGAGKVLESIVKKEIGCKVRSIELNLPQRCASHVASLTDLAEASRIGLYAVERAMAGERGIVIALEREATDTYAVKLTQVRAEEIANCIRNVPKHFIVDAENYVTEECLQYILPLIQGESAPLYDRGLPVHIRFI